MPGSRCWYACIVKAGCECPTRSRTTLIGTPDMISSDACAAASDGTGSGEGSGVCSTVRSKSWLTDSGLRNRPDGHRSARPRADGTPPLPAVRGDDHHLDGGAVLPHLHQHLRLETRPLERRTGLRTSRCATPSRSPAESALVGSGEQVTSGCELRAGGHPDLVVDVGEMGLDGRYADEEALSHVLVREAGTRRGGQRPAPSASGSTTRRGSVDAGPCPGGAARSLRPS